MITVNKHKILFLILVAFYIFCDLKNFKIDLVNQRKVSEQQGRQLADELKLPYIETSAKDPPINVDAAFHELVRIVKSFPDDDDAIEVG